MDAPTNPTTGPRTMTAWMQGRYGPLEAMTCRDVPVPAPSAGEVLVRVAAAGVDPSIWHLMTGTPYLVRLVMGLRAPRVPVPGQDAAGTVVQLGEGATSLEVGQRVFGAVRGRPRLLMGIVVASMPLAECVSSTHAKSRHREVPG